MEKQSSEDVLKRRLAITIPQHSDDSAEESPGTSSRLRQSSGSLYSPGSPISGSPVHAGSPLRKLFTPRSPSSKQKKTDKPSSRNNSPGRPSEEKEQKKAVPTLQLTQEEKDAYFPEDFWQE